MIIYSSLEPLQFHKEDHGIHETQFLVVESSGQSAKFLEAQALPQVHGRLVGADDEVELDRLESHFAGDLDTILAHLAADTLSTGFT